MSWKIERDGHVAIVTMNTNKVNSQNEAFYNDLDEAFETLKNDHHDCSVVLTGEGKVFSAGLDFNEVFALFGSKDESKINGWFDRYRATNMKLFTYPRMTIAAMNGHAYAGGYVTAMGCDYRICAEGPIEISLNEVKIGIPMPSVYLEILSYATSRSITARVAEFCEVFSPEKAKEIGIVHETCPKDILIERAVDKAKSISPDSVLAYEYTKNALQAETLDRIEKLSSRIDQTFAPIISDKRSLSALAARYEMIKKEKPSWDPR